MSDHTLADPASATPESADPVEPELETMIAAEPRPAFPVSGRSLFTAVLVTLSTVFVAWNVQPDLWFQDTTPTGGDMGAHVWSPAYLRDVLLPEFRLTGWSPDWYAGFPAFTFYMIIPSLLIVMVNVGVGYLIR